MAWYQEKIQSYDSRSHFILFPIVYMIIRKKKRKVRVQSLQKKTLTTTSPFKCDLDKVKVFVV